MTHLREVVVVEIAVRKVAADDGTVCEAAAKSIGAVALDATANLDRILPHDLSKVTDRTTHYGSTIAASRGEVIVGYFTVPRIDGVFVRLGNCRRSTRHKSGPIQILASTIAVSVRGVARRARVGVSLRFGFEGGAARGNGCGAV